jgi:ubiquinone/menaquinone biosynthesis C-methylase UbiE
MHGKFSAASPGGYVVDIPYPDTFFRELSPTWLNYVAALNGVAVRDLDSPFAYLELGCGLGYTVVTNAGAFPHARFHACDVNPAHVEHARRRASAAAIGNVEFHTCDFEELRRTGLPMFDFIVAHGVYSWVGEQDRQVIRQLVRDHLKPAGLLYVSYNSLPGWAPELPLRRLLVELAAEEKHRDTSTRTARALRSLQSLAGQRLTFLQANPASAAAIVTYASAPLPYLAHEFLNRDWEPLYCVDVADQLRESQVVYVGSATLAENHAPLVVDEATWMSICQLATQHQRRLALDFATNQQFRRDVFWRTTSQAAVAQSLLDSRAVGCAAHPGNLPGEVRVPRGILRLQESFVRRLQGLMADGPITIGAAVSGLSHTVQEADESRRNLQYLVAAGALVPFARTTAPHASADERQPASETIARILRYCIERDVECVLPSELMGNGVRITPAEAAAVSAWLAGECGVDPDLVRRLRYVGILR